MGIVLLVGLVAALFEVAAMWRVYTKAGRPGWGVLIPLYNTYLLCRIANRPGWWLILFFIPVVNIVVTIVVWHDVSKGFGHGGGFTLGLLLLGFIFVPVLGFGSSRYLGTIYR